MKKLSKLILKTAALILFIGVGIAIRASIEQSEKSKAYQTYGTDAFFENHYLEKDRSYKRTPRISSRDGDLVRVGKSIGLKHIDKLNTVALTAKNISNYARKYGVKEEVVHGYYNDKTRTIYINKNTSESELKLRLAHEYLHFIWFEPESLLANDEKLNSGLMLLLNNKDFYDYIKTSYLNTNTYTPSELFSFACTEFKDSELAQYVVEQCNKWLDRSKIGL